MAGVAGPQKTGPATVVTVPLTTLLSYCLVLGAGPLPELGVSGAGWAVPDVPGDRPRPARGRRRCA